MRPIPTLSELQTALSNDFKSKLNIYSDSLKKTLDAFTAVISAKTKLLYLFLSDVQNNIFPDTADLEQNGGTLERIGRIYLNRNPRPATVGVFEFSVTGVAGSVLRSGLTFLSNEDAKSPGQLFVLDAEYTLTGTDDIIEVRSLGSGTDFALDVNDNLTITEPVLGVNQTVTVSTILEEPLAGEDIEVYRQAILDAIQLEPQGGSKTDYRLWASDAQGVRKVYPYVKNGDTGVVQIYVEGTELDVDGNPKITSNSLLNDVEYVIEFDPDESKPLNERGRKPIQATLEMLSIDLVPVDVTITGLSNNVQSVKDAITQNMRAYLSDIRPYIAGADLPRSKNDILYEARLKSVATDVLESSNFFTNFVMNVDGNSVSSYVFELGAVPKLNSVTFN